MEIGKRHEEVLGARELYLRWIVGNLNVSGLQGEASSSRQARPPQVYDHASA
jgi:hypothetical protein